MPFLTSVSKLFPVPYHERCLAQDMKSHHNALWFWFQSEHSNYLLVLQAAMAVTRMGNHLEYGRVPPVQVAAVVHSLLGALHIRFVPDLTPSLRKVPHMSCCTAIWCALYDTPWPGVRLKFRCQKHPK